jgi:hypothetical protein
MQLQSSKTQTTPHPARAAKHRPTVCPVALYSRYSATRQQRNPTGHAFLNARGKPWANQAFNIALKNHARISGVAGEVGGLTISSHGLRAGGATYSATVRGMTLPQLRAWGRWSERSLIPRTYIRVAHWNDNDTHRD